MWGYRNHGAAHEKLISSPENRVTDRMGDEPIQTAMWESIEIESPADSRLTELGRMSETFRNVTLLIAIRDAGLLCYDFLGARYSGSEDRGAWFVTCGEALYYLVAVDDAGDLIVDLAPNVDRYWQIRAPSGPDLLPERPLLDESLR